MEEETRTAAVMTIFFNRYFRAVACPRDEASTGSASAFCRPANPWLPSAVVVFALQSMAMTR